jgi:hypothetical protein
LEIVNEASLSINCVEPWYLYHPSNTAGVEFIAYKPFC